MRRRSASSKGRRSSAPSFGPVHNRPAGGRCRCGRTHPDDDPALGTPLDPDRYDYRAAVLW
uniref:replication initiator n=1 Tax=Streptomyces sp. NRRL B-12105 TaxID=1463827 RepID=UPI0005663A1E